MTTVFRLFLLITAAAVSTPVRAQEAEPIRWGLEEFRTRCIPLWSDYPTVEEEDCTVADFGEIVELDGSTFYFARYHDRSRPFPDELPSYMVIEFNVLVILRSDPPNLEDATVVHVRRHEEEYGFLTILAPELLQTDRGPILYLAGRGLGSGTSQYKYDEYWLWRSGTWLPLDMHGWFNVFWDRILEGFWLSGIFDLATALSTMTYVAPVHSDEDAQCCPSGGTIWIHFEWDDLTLRVVSFEHDPSVQFQFTE